ncbi:MAG: 3-deoxy-D-manno-octulosonic acid transferase [Bacteroidales bacterium]|nr:3-deoxy-D-manno-octulosonic acid transferase [Bacteroidales bacterium]
MSYLYELGLIIFRLLLIVVSPFNSKAKLWINGRKKLLLRISEKLSTESNEKRIWVHVASLGEFEQGRPIIEHIKKSRPEYIIILTFFSPSGYEIRKNYEYADYVFYLPEDTARNAKIFINILQPEMALFIKYEYWYNHLMYLKKKKIPVYMVSAVFRKNHIFFKWYGFWYRKMLNTINYFFVQNETSKQLLNKLGYINVRVGGDTRFDRVVEIAKKASNYPVIENFKGDAKILIAGSTWKEDEEILIDYINNSKNKGWKYIIAPHEIQESNIKRIESALQKSTFKYSDAKTVNLDEKEVLIINNVGMLSSIYQYGDIAYIGGGFNTGIHNILEPATFGLPVIFGPDYEDFQEAHELIRMGGAYTIKNNKNFADIINELITNNLIKKKGGICKNYIEQNKGATIKIVDWIFN